MAAVAGYRLWLAHAFQKSPPAPEASPAWGLRYIVATTITGLGWGVSTWLFPTLEGGSRMGTTASR